MNTAEIRELFRNALQLAEELPDKMQEAGFNKAVDLLAQREGREQVTNRGKEQRGHASSSRPRSTPVRPKRSGRPGPKAAIAELVDTEFLRGFRTVPQMQDQLKQKRGHEYSLNELAISAVRLVRDDVLDRETNKEGKYAYKSKLARG